MMPSQNIAVNAWRPNLMATRFLPNFDKGAEPPICRIIFSIIAIFHKGLVQISFSLSSPTLRHYPKIDEKINLIAMTPNSSPNTTAASMSLSSVAILEYNSEAKLCVMTDVFVLLCCQLGPR